MGLAGTGLLRRGTRDAGSAAGSENGALALASLSRPAALPASRVPNATLLVLPPPRRYLTSMRPSLSRSRLQTLLRSATGKRIAVVGDAMLDVYLKGDVDRISPEAPVPVVRVRERRSALGGAANVAQNVAALGANAELVAVVGRDASAKALRAMLKELGGETRALVEVERPTTTKTRVLARVQQVVRFDEEDDADLGAAEIARVLNAVAHAVADADALVLEDYNKGVLAPAGDPRGDRCGERARHSGGGRSEIPEFLRVQGRHDVQAEPARTRNRARRHDGRRPSRDRAGDARAARRRARAAHARRARHGARERATANAMRVPTTAREVYDVVGAGDTVTAYLAAMLAAGGTVEEASMIANFAAGVEVGKLGAATVDGDEVLAAYDAYAAYVKGGG